MQTAAGTADAAGAAGAAAAAATAVAAATAGASSAVRKTAEPNAQVRTAHNNACVRAQCKAMQQKNDKQPNIQVKTICKCNHAYTFNNNAMQCSATEST